jgi:ketosteroid isomerase-like protein
MKIVNKNYGLLGIKSAGQATLWAILFVFLVTCSEKDDVSAIRELIKKGAELAEDHDVGGIIDLTTEDVVAHPGQVNRLEIKRIIWRAFQHYGKLKVLYPKPSVDVSARDNTAACLAYLLIVKKKQALPDVKEFYDDPRRWLETVGENADLYQIKLQMIKKEGKWWVQQAHLEGFKGFGFSN